MESAFDRASRYAGRLSNFGLFQALEVAELDDLAVVLRKLIERTCQINVQGPLAFGSLLGFFRKVLGGPKLRCGPVRRAPGAIAREVDGDGENPRFEPS